MNPTQHAFKTLDAREKGAFPISIATSLAFESLLGIYPEREHQSIVIGQADAIYINWQTLFRNLVGSMTKEDRMVPHPVDFAATIANELEVIYQIASDNTGDMTEIVPYLCSYNAINRRFPYALHWNPSSPAQLDMVTLEENTFKEFERSYDTGQLIRLDLDFTDDPRNVFMLTHHPVNLLNRYRFRDLKLLESHTGALKSSAQWASKLTGLKDSTAIPFDRMTLQVFGDGVMFKSMPVKLKRHMVALAEKNKWSVTTTKDKIVHDIKAERDPVLEAFVLKLY